MFFHIYVTNDDAKRLFVAFARKPLKPGECGPMTQPTFELEFAQCLQTHLDKLGAQLEIVRSADMFVLKFNRYLPRLPVELIDMEIVPVKVEIVRFNSAPTKARAGYYEFERTGLTAVVERIYPVQREMDGRAKKGVPLYAQNIWVTGPTLAAALEHHSKLSMGSYARHMVNAFE